jgi:hypothetical protein
VAWDSESVILLRGVILDDQEPFTYSDDRLLQIIVSGAFQVNVKANGLLKHTYRVDVENISIDPDPSGTSLGDSERDESFINLMVLKTACILQQGAIKTAASQSIAIKDGASSIDTRGQATALLQLLKDGTSFCKEFGEAFSKFQHDNTATAGAAIVGPYRVSLAGTPGYSLGGHRRYF